MARASAPDPNDNALLLVNISQLVTLWSPSAAPGPRRGTELSSLGIIEDGAVLCTGGRIVSVGRSREALRDPWIKSRRKRIREVDCRGRVVLPGFVDAHTHPAFMAPRLADFEKRIGGATYEEIAAAGGGIRSSIVAVRKATREELTERVLGVFNEILAQGTTTVEAKSGYGLSAAAEIKSLEAIHAAAERWPGTVVSTFLGAHVVPPEFDGRGAAYVEQVCGRMIPQVARRRLAQFVDIFCDRGAFTPEDAERVFAAARNNGLGTRAHVCQLGACELAPLLRYTPASLDHLDHIADNQIPRLAASTTVATLVPGANYFLGLDRYPPARKLIDSGVAVALATDCNPGTSPVASMPFVLSLACIHMRMSPGEAIAAATLNAAHALGLGDRKGSIEPGKDADLAIFAVEDHREIPYWVAANRCVGVVAGGSWRLEETDA